MKIIIRNLLIAVKDCLLFLGLTSFTLLPFYLFDKYSNGLFVIHGREWESLITLGIAETLACITLLHYRRYLSEFIESAFKNYIDITIMSLGCMVGVIFPILIVILLNLSGHFELRRLDKINYSAILFFIPIMLLACIEEVLFRYYILKRLSYKTNIISSVMISSVLFGIFHSFNPNFSALSFVNIVLFGIIMSLIYIISNENLLLITTIHACWNFISGVIMGGAVSGLDFPTLALKLSIVKSDQFSGGSFGIEGSVLTTVFLSLIILTLIPYIDKIHQKKSVIHHT